MKFGTYVTQFKVEVYPLVLKLCVYPAVNDIKVSLFSTTNNSIFCLFTLDGSLNCKRVIVQCTDIIVESNIDPIVLARKLYSKQIISEHVYKIVKDKKTGDTSTDRN